MLKNISYSKLVKQMVFVVMLLLVMASPAFADAGDVQDLNNKVAITCLFIALTIITVVVCYYLFKAHYVLLAGFLLVAVIVLLIVGTKGMILLVPVKWAASWFGVQTITW